MGKRLKERRAAENVPATRPPAPPDPQPDKTPALVKALASDKREDRQFGAGFLFTQAFGGGVMQRQLGGLLSESMSASAGDFIGAVIASIKPRDLVEQMLCVQMAWTHARLARLWTTAATQENLKSFTAVHQAADAATNSFRRLMQALADYRAPRRGEGFTAVKHQYNANQQVIQNGKTENGNATNEQGLQHAGSMPDPALPAVANRAGVPAAVGREGQALAVEQRPQDAGRQGAVEQERNPAR